MIYCNKATLASILITAVVVGACSCGPLGLQRLQSGKTLKAFIGVWLFQEQTRLKVQDVTDWNVLCTSFKSIVSGTCFTRRENYSTQGTLVDMGYMESQGECLRCIQTTASSHVQSIYISTPVPSQGHAAFALLVVSFVVLCPELHKCSRQLSRQELSFSNTRQGSESSAFLSVDSSLTTNRD